MTGKHPNFEIPTEPHAKARYESAMKHIAAAKKAGKSSDEMHAIFKKIMAFNPMDIESIPNDKTHAKYRTAMIHVKKAREAGKSNEEIHAMYMRIMNGTSTGCHKK